MSLRQFPGTMLLCCGAVGLVATARYSATAQSSDNLVSRHPVVAQQSASAGFRLEATTFRVELPREKIAELDARKLSADAVTPQKLQKNLESFGPTEICFRVDQPIGDDGELSKLLSMTRDVPYSIGSVQATTTAPAVPRLARTKVGAQLLAGTSPGESSPDVTRVELELRIEVTGINESRLQTDSAANAPVFTNFEQYFHATAVLGQPIVLFGIDSGRTPVDDKTYALVTVVTVH